jgi:hypothetical protein
MTHMLAMLINSHAQHCQPQRIGVLAAESTAPAYRSSVPLQCREYRFAVKVSTCNNLPSKKKYHVGGTDSLWVCLQPDQRPAAHSRCVHECAPKPPNISIIKHNI